MEEDKKPARASTVILVRQGDGEVQVYLLKRSHESSFMPGNYVFPGGTVDPEDWDGRLLKAHVDLSPEEISLRLGGGITQEEALAHGVAAIRETLEEAGIFLAYHSDQSLGGPEEVRVPRAAERRSRGWFLDWVLGQGWTLAFSGLARWAHWVTPKVRRQRYDTRFFLASMPQGQECLPDDLETTHGIWISPEEALRGNLEGKIPLSPPTLVTLHELLPFAREDQLEEEARKRSWGEPRLPRLVPLQDGALLLMPWDSQYDEEVQILADQPDPAPLPPGRPLSRLLYRQGLWTPVKD